MKREKKIARKIIKHRNSDNIFSKVGVVRYEVYDIERLDQVEKDGLYGYKFKVYYATGFNWFNPLTYIVLFGLFLFECCKLGIEMIGDLSESTYVERVDIMDAEQTKMDLGE